MVDAFIAGLDGPVGHIVHIGAGEGRGLSTYLAARPEAVTLIEPDPGQLPRLQAAAAGHDSVHVIEVAVSPDPNAGILHRFAFGDLNSLRRPTGLWQLFPSLEELAGVPVTRRDPVALVCGLDLKKDRTHVLVIEAPGEVLGIVQALNEAGLLTCFAAIRVQEGQGSLYQGAGTFAQVRAMLEVSGFSHEPQIDEADPDRPVLSVLFDVEGQRRKALEVQLTAFEVKCDVQSRELEAKDVQIAALTSAGEERKSQFVVLSNAREAVAEQVNSMTVEHEATMENLVALEAKCGEQDALVKELRQQEAEAQQNLSVSLRMQMLREADLKDLQQRYGDLLQNKEAQDDLLSRLTASLSNAAHYLQDMEETPVKPARRRKTVSRKPKTVTTPHE